MNVCKFWYNKSCTSEFKLKVVRVITSNAILPCLDSLTFRSYKLHTIRFALYRKLFKSVSTNEKA